MSNFFFNVLDSMNPEVVQDNMAHQHNDNMVQQHAERFASTLNIDSSKTSSGNSSGCKGYESEYKGRYPSKKEVEVEVLPAFLLIEPNDKMPDLSLISDNEKKVDVLDTKHARLFYSPEVTDAISVTDSKLQLQFNTRQDCESTLEPLPLPSQRPDAIHADNTTPNNSLQPVQQHTETDNTRESMPQHPPDPVANVTDNSPVAVEGDDDDDDDIDDEIVVMPEDASNCHNTMMVMPNVDNNFLQQASGKYIP